MNIYNPRMLSAFLDFLFPPKCPNCGNSVSSSGQMCAKCWDKISWITNPCCAKCGLPFPANLGFGENTLCPNCASHKSKLDWMRSACVYDDASRDIILPFKHASKLEYTDIIANAMILAMRDIKKTGIGDDFIVMPVPLAYRRLFKRGYNQAGLVSKPIAKHLAAKIDYDSVARIYRKDMGHKNATERQKNISGVFNVTHPENIREKNILLVDDVFTTGATFNELAKVLKKSGAKWVGGITFCRVVRAI
jgi:ComF family protein